MTLDLPRIIVVLMAGLACWTAPGQLTAAQGVNDPSFSPSDDGTFGEGANQLVYSSAVQGDGRILIAGQFESYNGRARKHLARLNADGSLDESLRTQPGPDYPVRAVTVQPDGKLIVGGEFSTYDGVPRRSIARLNSDGSLDTSFHPGTGADYIVSSVAVQPDGRVMIAGYFSTVDGAPRVGLARLNADGSLDASFGASASPNGAVLDFTRLADGRYLVVGGFSTYGGLPRRRIARLQTNGAVDTSFDPGAGADGTVASMDLLSDGRIVIGGGFNSFGGVARHRVARLLPDGPLDTSFVPALPGASTVSTVALQSDGKLVLSGSFASNGGLLRLHPTGATDASFAPSGGGNPSLSHVRVLASGKLLVTGEVFATLPFGKRGVARVDANGVRDPSFNAIAGPDNVVRRIVPQTDGKALLVGDFEVYAGVARKSIARIDVDGALDLGFDPGAGPSSSATDAAIRPDGKIVVVGSFASFDGVPIRNVARLHPDGSVDSGFDPGAGPNSIVKAVALQPDARVLLAGAFTAVDGFASRGVARIHADGAIDTSFAASVEGGIVRTVLLQPDGRILIGGEFSSVSGALHRGVVRLNADGSRDPSFASSPGVSWYVQSVALQPDGKVLIGGSFFSYNGTPCGHIVRVNADGSLDTTFSPLPGVTHPSLTPLVYSIALQPDGEVLLGGDFTTAGGRPRWFLARLHGADGSLDASFPGVPGAGWAVTSIALDSNGRALIGGAFTWYDGVVRSRIARVIAYSPTPVSYCTAGTSTNGCAASVSFTGAPSIASASGFTLDVDNLDGQRQALLFYGVGGRRAEPWAAGSTSFLCVKAPVQRMLVASSGGSTGQCNGALSTDWLAYLAAHPSAAGAPFAAGVAVNAQAWYRDPPAPRATNLSDALEFVTTP